VPNATSNENQAGQNMSIILQLRKAVNETTSAMLSHAYKAIIFIYYLSLLFCFVTNVYLNQINFSFLITLKSQIRNCTNFFGLTFSSA